MLDDRFARNCLIGGVIGLVLALLVISAVAQDLPPTSEPAQPQRDEIDGEAIITSRWHVTDPVRLEAKAVALLKAQSGLTTAQAKAFLRPAGELDEQRCFEVVLVARIRAETDGFTARATTVRRVPVDAPAVPAPER